MAPLQRSKTWRPLSSHSDTFRTLFNRNEHRVFPWNKRVFFV